jgi:hypothetical protein
LDPHFLTPRALFYDLLPIEVTDWLGLSPQSAYFSVSLRLATCSFSGEVSRLRSLACCHQTAVAVMRYPTSGMERDTLKETPRGRLKEKAFIKLLLSGRQFSAGMF